MGRHRLLHGTAVGLFGLALALTPLTAASASTKSNHHPTAPHSSKHKKKHPTTTTTKAASNPGSSLCKDLRTEQSSSSQLGGQISAALKAGNYGAAKQAMLNTLNTAGKEAGPALAELKNAPSVVRTAMQALISFYNTFKKTVQNSTSLQGLVASLAQLAKNPQLATDGTTVSNYVTSQCGSIAPTTVPTTVP